MIRAIFGSVILLVTVLSGCTGIPKGLEPVTDFEPDRYLGKWYEIARLDHSFERGLTNVSAEYTRKDNGDIRVLNRGFKVKTGEWKDIEGRARLIKDDKVGSLKVSFFGPFYGGYHIIELDKINYSYAMVSGPSRSYLWILSRERNMDEGIYAKLVSRADKLGFETEQLILVAHDRTDN